MKKKPTRFIILTTITACLAAPAASETLQPNNAVIANTDRLGQVLGPRAEINATSDKTTASITVGFGDPGYSKETKNPDVRFFNNWALTLSAPLNKSGEPTEIATLDGLANSTKLSFRFSRFTSQVKSAIIPTNADYLRILNLAKQACITKEGLEEAEKKCSGSPENGGPQNLIDDYAPELNREYTSLLFGNSSNSWGFEGSIGRTRFDFLDSLSLAEKVTTKFPVQAKAFLSIYPSSSLTSLNAAIAYERSYVGAKSVTICPQPPATGPFICPTGALSGPANDTSLLLSFDLRHRFANNGKLRNFAVSPQVTYDALDNVFGVDVPIYIIPDTDSGLTGGFRVGYRTDTDKVSIGLFVGAAFSVF